MKEYVKEKANIEKYRIRIGDFVSVQFTDGVQCIHKAEVLRLSYMSEMPWILKEKDTIIYVQRFSKMIVEKRG